MIQDYPVLRIREKDNKLECELTDPTSMQVTEIDVRVAALRKKSIQVHYERIIRMMGKRERPPVGVFNKELKPLASEIGQILARILRKLDF